MKKENILKTYKEYYRDDKKTGYLVSENGQIYSTKTNSYLIPAIGTDGRYQVCLSINGKSITEKVHIIVYTTYVGKIPENFTIDHIDENFYNNYYKNLEAVTRSENTKRYLKNHGDIDKKYSDEFIDTICKKLSKGIYYRDISKEYDIPIFYMYQLVHGLIRKSISDKYIPFPESSYRIKTNRSEDKEIISELILSNNKFSTREICEKMGIEYNNANIKIINKIRKKYNVKSPRFYDDNFVNTIKNYINSGKSNSQIIKEMNIDYTKKIGYLFTRLRKELNIPDFNENRLSLENQEKNVKLIIEGKSNKEICELMLLDRNTYIINMFGRLRQKVKKQQSSTTRES